MSAAGVATESERASSPTRSAQEVLRRMSLNSPPSRTDNPRQIKRAKLLAWESRASASRAFAVPQAVQTPATIRKLTRPSSRAAVLDRPSPMPSWDVNLRDASAGESLEAVDHDASSFYPSFQLDCLREPYGGGSPGAAGKAVGGSPASTTMDDDDRDFDGDDHANHGASLQSAGGEEDSFAPPPTPARLEMLDGGGVRTRELGEIAAALEEARHFGGAGAGVGVPETPLRRPGSGARSRVLERGAATRGDHNSCSPVGGYAGSDGSTVQGSPVKKRQVGRWRLSEEGRLETAMTEERRRARFSETPLLTNRNPFSPSRDEEGDEGGAMSMPAPPPRSRLSAGKGVDGSPIDGSPMDTGDIVDGVDFGTMSAGKGENKDCFLRRVSVGSSCSSIANNTWKMPFQDATRPSPCDVAAFVPITPCRGGNEAGMAEAGMREGDEGGRNAVGEGGQAGRGRFATDFEVMEVIGSGGFGTVYKVRSRVDGCLYAVKCSRRRFKGETDRQHMLMEVYALAAVCDSAQETINIVRYHQAWIEDERLYIQTELCETSLEKQLEMGHRLEIDGVYAFLRQTLLGLEILHQHKLVHLDIKPGNIFVKNGQYKLGDLGLVTPVHVRSSADVVEGDSRYMSKELLNDDHSNLTKCDVFSLGITLYEIISGRPLPPNGEEWHRLRSGEAGMPMGLPAELVKTLNEMMHPDPSRRPSAAELLRYPCLQSEMERQLNDQKSELSKERTRNSGLLEEVSALIQKQSHRSGRLSRTITWDNSYFAANGTLGASSSSSTLSRKANDGMADHFAARGGSGAGAGAGVRFIPSPPKARASANRGDEAVGGGLGHGMPPLSSLDEKEEEGSVSPVAAEGWSGAAGRPASFERLREAQGLK